MLYEDLEPPRRGPGWAGRFLVALALLGALAGGGAWWALGRPEYALYRLQQAVVAHDLPAFEAGFDTASVVGQLVDELWARWQQEAQAHAGATVDPSQAMGRRLALGLVELVAAGVKPKLKALATQAVEERLKQEFLGLPAAGAGVGGQVPEAVGAAPRFRLAGVQLEGKRAIAQVVRADGRLALGLILVQGPSGWRVVGLDAPTVAKLLPSELSPPGLRN